MAYSVERRAAVLKRMQAPNAVPLRQLAREVERRDIGGQERQRVSDTHVRHLRLAKEQPGVSSMLCGAPPRTISGLHPLVCPILNGWLSSVS